VTIFRRLVDKIRITSRVCAIPFPTNRARQRPRLLTLEDRCTPTAVTWDGGAGTLNWGDANNWSPDGVPGAADDVTVNAAGAVTVTFSGGASTIKSLQLAASLTVSGGNFVVTNGLTMNAGVSLTGTGPGVGVTVSGSSNIDGANLSAASGAKVALPGLTSFNGLAANSTFLCNGTGSELDLSALTSATAPTWTYSYLQLKALNGGHMKLNSLTSIENTMDITFYADGVGSAIDVPLLQTYTGDANFNWVMQASNGGAVHVPALTVASYANLFVDGLSSIDTAQIQTLCYGYLTVSGANLTFPALSSLNETSVVAQGGAILSFPLVTSYIVEDQYPPPCELRADGPGSKLDLSNCKTYGGSEFGPTAAYVRAFNGGQVDLSGVTSIDPADGQQIIADGTGSIIDLSSLSSCASDGTYVWTMTASNNGVIHLPSIGSTFVANATVTTSTGGSITTSLLNLGTGSFLDGDSVTGSVAGIGTIRPAGASATGTMKIAGNLSLSPGASLQTRISGTTAGNYDGLAVYGTVSLSGASLATTVDFSPTIGTTFKIIDNDGSDPVAGTFAGMACGATAATTPNGLFLLINYAGGDGNDVTLRAQPEGVQIEGGAVQRSMVRTLSVTFTGAVALGAGAFTLNGVSAIGQPINGVTINSSLDVSGKVATLTFSGAPIIGGSLPDGKYTLTVNGGAITVQASGLALDADADGTAGGLQSFDFHRLFGDANGDGAVGTNDFVLFRQAFNGMNNIFDFDGDGFVSVNDFIQFRNRFNSSI
jgi:hypothetical protein